MVSPPRPTGPTPTESTVRAWLGDDATAEEGLRRDSSAFRPGCGATPWCATSPTGCVTTQSKQVDRRRQAGFYGLDLYSMHRSMQEVIRLSRHGRPGSRGKCSSPLLVLRPRVGGRRRASLRVCGGVRRRAVVLAAGCRPAGRHFSGIRWSTRAATGCSPRTRPVYAERGMHRSFARRRSLLPGDVQRTGQLLEPSRPSHGRHAGRLTDAS